MKYPIYIPSMGRAGKCKTVALFVREKIPFNVVVEKKELKAYQEYLKNYAGVFVLPLPGSSYGTSTIARNFCIEHSIKQGYARHWQFDDDISNIWEHKSGIRLKTTVEDILSKMERMADADKRIGVIGMKTANFLKQVQEQPHVYNTSLTSAFLLNNSLGVRFRGIMYVDMDYQLQVLKKGYTTLKCQQYVFPFQPPMKHAGGYTDIYANDKRRIEAINVFLNNNPDITLPVHRNPQGYMAIKNFGTVWRKYKF